ncbi:unnamed protein product [Protopolystoma xenopodis]|uniref:Uncharacterized protein n=1 Tax=Protopolystoma xenopodis TaxID=117903 RepID=A0A3S5FH89_9PLAT|nr:unnamed protein product [Protopolystoma xenopodis]
MTRPRAQLVTTEMARGRGQSGLIQAAMTTRPSWQEPLAACARVKATKRPQPGGWRRFDPSQTRTERSAYASLWRPLLGTRRPDLSLSCPSPFLFDGSFVAATASRRAAARLPV